MKKLIIWAMALVFSMAVSLAFAADPVKKEEKKPADKPAVTAPAEPAKAEEKAPVKKVVKKKKVKKVKKAAPKEEKKEAPAAPAEKK